MHGCVHAGLALPRCEPTATIDIDITKTGELVKGAPEYNAVIHNTRPACLFYDVYAKCDGFDDTAEPVDPYTFKKEEDGTCLVRGGGGLRKSDLIKFKFASQAPVHFAIKNGTLTCD
ncbi:hypothetical protein NMG60_11033244 [Bertholletia excelsa]